MLVDDQSMVRAGLRMILESEADFTVVGEAADGVEAVEMAPRCRPDVILMDIRMPRMDGVEATSLILADQSGRERRPGGGDGERLQPRILVLTTFDLDDYVYGVLRSGASGFLLKDAPAEALIDAVRVVHRGDALLSPSVTRRLIEEVTRRPHLVHANVPGLDELTDRESEVLLLVARGLSNAEIAERLYLGEATVKTHLGRVLAKLNLRDRVQVVVLAYESGLVTPGVD